MWSSLIKRGVPLSLTKLLSFAVNGEFYFMGQFSGLLREVTSNYWATKVASHVQ